MTLIPRLDLASLDRQGLDPSTKGLPFDAPPTDGRRGRRQGWNVLKGDLPLPLAVIREDVVRANSAWMSAFTAANDLVIAPHGKTTMSPQLFDLQVADGAWAITVATVQQLGVCVRFGVKRVLIANQPVGEQAIDACFRALQQDGFELYCLADGLPGLTLLAEGAKRNPPPAGNPLRVLVEIGFLGGRTGARTREQAMEVARVVAATPGLVLGGFECFEGLLPTPEAADGLIDDVAALAVTALGEGLFPRRSAGGGERRRFGVLRPGRRALQPGGVRPAGGEGAALGLLPDARLDLLCRGVRADHQRHLAEAARGAARGGARGLGLCAVAARGRAHHADHGQARCQLRCRHAGAAALVPAGHDAAAGDDAGGQQWWR